MSHPSIPPSLHPSARPTTHSNATPRHGSFDAHGHLAIKKGLSETEAPAALPYFLLEVRPFVCVEEGMDGWMDGWMDERVDGWMDGWMNGWMDERVDGWMDGWMDGLVDG